MKFSKYFLTKVLLFLLFTCVFSPAYSASNKVKSIGFQLCAGGNCPNSKIEFSDCDKNAYIENGKCICSEGFVGNGKKCVQSTCSAGTFSIIDEDDIERCIECPEGYFCQNGTKEKCPDGTISSVGSTVCEKCPEQTYANEESNTCCPEAYKYDSEQKKCVVCQNGESCHCPETAPYSDGNGQCVECISNEQCPSGFCSNNSCCPENATTFLVKGNFLSNGCYCQKGFQPEAGECVPSPCFQVENSSKDGKGDKTSLEGCFCDINFPHWHNGRCMRAKDCSVLMEHYGFRKNIDFQEPYRKDDQVFLNTIYVPNSFKTNSDMDLTGCNLWVDGHFQNNHKLIVDSLYINFSDFVYHNILNAQNRGEIITKGLTASRLTNEGTIKAFDANVNFGYLENKGRIFVDGIYEVNESPAIVKNMGVITVLKDFLFGSISETGYIKNTGKIIVGENWDSNNIQNWGDIIVHKKMNKTNKDIYNVGRIVAGEDE